MSGRDGVMLIIVMSSDKTNHLLTGFFHQWQKYAEQLPPHCHPSVVVTNTKEPPCELPKNWMVYFAGADTPQQHWAGLRCSIDG